MRRLPRKLAMWGGATALAGAGFAFMASNTFTSAPAAGAGTVTVSGFTISSPTFTGCGTTTANNPEDICYAHFDAMPAASTASTAGTAYVRFGTTAGTTNWYHCVGAGTYTGNNRPFTCDLRSPNGTGPLYPGTVNNMTVSAIDFPPTP